MSFGSIIAGWFTQTITLQSPSGGSGHYGDPAWGSQTTAQARVEVSQKRINTGAGQSIQASHRVFSTTALDCSMRVWIPGDDTGSATAARRVIQVSQAFDPLANAISHYEAYLG